MHSSIIQISILPPNKVRPIQAIDFCDCNDFDYCDDVDSQYRADAIKNLVEADLPKGMFSIGEEPDTIVYNGGYSMWLSQWKNDFNKRVIKLQNSKDVFGTAEEHHVMKAIENCLDTDTLFYTSDEWMGAYTEKSSAVMALVKCLKPGDRLYIGTILDYHY